MGQRQREPRGWALTPRLIRINGLTRVNIWNGECCVAVHALQFPSEESVSFVKGVLDSSTIPYLYSSGNHDWHFEGLPGSSDDLRAEWREKSLLPLYGKRGNSLSFSYSSSRPRACLGKVVYFHKKLSQYAVSAGGRNPSHWSEDSPSGLRFVAIDNSTYQISEEQLGADGAAAGKNAPFPKFRILKMCEKG